MAMDSIADNIAELGLSGQVSALKNIDYFTVKSPKVEKLIRKSFNKFSRDISSNVLNTLNTGKIDDLNRYMNDYFKKENKSNSLLNRIMRVSRTENTQTRSAVKLNALKQYQEQGFNLKKRWIHTLSVSYNVISDNYTPRQDHLDLDGTVCDDEGYFHTDNGKTLAPGMFGIPEEDINCRCDIDFIL